MHELSTQTFKQSIPNSTSYIGKQMRSFTVGASNPCTQQVFAMSAFPLQEAPAIKKKYNASVKVKGAIHGGAREEDDGIRISCLLPVSFYHISDFKITSRSSSPEFQDSLAVGDIAVLRRMGEWVIINSAHAGGTTVFSTRLSWVSYVAELQPGLGWCCLSTCPLIAHDVTMWEFPKIGGTILGVLIISIIVYWGLCWGPPILGNYHVTWVSCYSI